MITEEERAKLHAATVHVKFTYAELAAIDVLLSGAIGGDHSTASEHERSARAKVSQERAALEEEWLAHRVTAKA